MFFRKIRDRYDRVIETNFRQYIEPFGGFFGAAS
jgi:hypothetical protein